MNKKFRQIAIKIHKEEATYEEYIEYMDYFINKGKFYVPECFCDYFVDYMKINNNYEKLLSNCKKSNGEIILLKKVFNACNLNKVAEYVVDVYNKPQNSFIIADLFKRHCFFKNIMYIDNYKFYAYYIQPYLHLLLSIINPYVFLTFFKGHLSVRDELLVVDFIVDVGYYETYAGFLKSQRAKDRLKSKYFIGEIIS